MSANPAIADRPLFGIMLMLGFCLLAPLGDSIAKLLGDLVPLGMLLLVRFAMQSVLLLPSSLGNGALLRLPRRALRLILWRTLLHIVGIGAMFTALRFMPLAETVAIAFVMPFIILLLGRFVLDEEVGPHRLAACAVGFGGTLLVLQPNFAAVGWPALLPLLVALVFALFMMVTRQIAKDVDAVTLQSVGGLMASGLILPVMILGPDWPVLGFVRPDPAALWLLAGLGMLGTFAHLLMTWSLRFAPSATLAPMQYLEIPFATLIGWMIFDDLPDGLAALGIAVTVGAGLYVIRREQAIARPRFPAPPAP